MGWIDGIGVHSEKFVLNAVSADGKHRELGLAEISQPWCSGRGIRSRVTTDCNSWKLESGEPFWSALGLDGSKLENRHTVFSFESDGKQYLLPASLLISTMMRPIDRLHSFLFRPQGLGNFSIPLQTEVGPSVGFWQSRTAIFGRTNTYTAGGLAVLSWMHCFPSANAMWSSVYLAACDGRLDIKPPNAKLTATLRAIKRGGTYLITELQMTRLLALEDPYPFATGHTADIVVHAASTIDWESLRLPVSTIPPRKNEQWSLTNGEWRVLEALFPNRVQRKYSLRSIIDCILTKLGTGHAWRKLEFGDLNFSIVQATYQRMTKSGEWAGLASALRTLRS